MEKKIYRCKRCKDEFDENELKELRQLHEHYNLKPFICPDCWDTFQQLDTEDQARYLIADQFDW